MRRESFGMSIGASRWQAAERLFGGGSRYGLRDVFTPLDTLLASGGGPRRLCVGARNVTDAWSADEAQVQRNLQHVLDRIAHVLVKIELLLGRVDGAALPGKSVFEV
ncbi:hypothetical protein [Bradyrhizobium sp. ISRA442]